MWLRRSLWCCLTINAIARSGVIRAFDSSLILPKRDNTCVVSQSQFGISAGPFYIIRCGDCDLRVQKLRVYTFEVVQLELVNSAPPSNP